MEKQLQNKIALITGGGSGIGRQAALLMAEEGATVIVAGRREERLAETVAMIQARGGQGDWFALNLRDKENIDSVIGEILSIYGRIDVLVNNAGYSKEAPFLELSEESWNDILQVNLLAPMQCTRLVLPGMLERGEGAIVNVASAAGQRGLPNSTAYSAAKSGLIAATQALGEEIRLTGVRANTLCPGPVDTEILQNSNVREYLLASKTDLCGPEDTAKGILFLASPLSGYMNAQSISWRARYRW